jgi:hypothetical protein
MSRSFAIMPGWAAAAAIIGGLAWIPVRLGVSVAFSTEFLRLTYVRWNMLMVVPLVLLLVATAALASRVRSRPGRIGAWVAAAGLAGMLAGVIVEFWIFGGLAGDRDGAVLGWLIYLTAGLLVHVIGLIGFGIVAVRTPGWVAVGALALVIAALHLAWLPSGILGDAFLEANQVLIGLAWVAVGIVSLGRRTAVR